jgi:hypothetical protein
MNTNNTIPGTGMNTNNITPGAGMGLFDSLYVDEYL